MFACRDIAKRLLILTYQFNICYVDSYHEVHVWEGENCIKKVAKGPKITSFCVINSHWFQNEKKENILILKHANKF